MWNTGYYLLALLALLAAFGFGVGVTSIRHQRKMSRRPLLAIPVDADLAAEKLRLEIADLQASPARARSVDRLAYASLAASSLTAVAIAVMGWAISLAIQNQSNRNEAANHYDKLLSQLYDKEAAVRTGAVDGLAHYLEPQQVDDRSQATTAILLRRLREDTDEGVYSEIVTRLSSVESDGAVQQVFQQTGAFQKTLPQLLVELSQREHEIQDGCRARAKWVTADAALAETRVEYDDDLQDIHVANKSYPNDSRAERWVYHLLPAVPAELPTPPPHLNACDLRRSDAELPRRDPDLRANTTLHATTINGFVGSASILGNLASTHRHVFDGADVSWLIVFLPDQATSPSFTHAHLVGLTIVGNANGATFTDAALCYADFYDASFHHASFMGADLSRAVFRMRSVSMTLASSPHIFDGADWSGATFLSSDLPDSSMGIRGNDQDDPDWKSFVKRLPASARLSSKCG